MYTIWLCTYVYNLVCPHIRPGDKAIGHYGACKVVEEPGMYYYTVVIYVCTYMNLAI